MGNWTHAILGLLVLTGVAMAGDLDDGIAIDEPINDDIELGINLSFIINKTLSKQQSGIVDEDGIGVVGQGNIVVKPGANLNNVTIINAPKISGATAISGAR